MTLKRLMSMRFCLSLGVAASVAGLMAARQTGPAPNLDRGGVVFVYFPSLCAAAGDARDCHEMIQPVRPSFQSMAACMAHANADLDRVHDPRVLASCQKEREA